SNPQLPQLCLVHRRWRIHHLVARLRRLREWDHITQALAAAQDHNDTVQPERDTAMRWRAVLQRFQEEAEARARLVVTHSQRAEDLRLHILPMDTHRPRP